VGREVAQGRIRADGQEHPTAKTDTNQAQVGPIGGSSRDSLAGAGWTCREAGKFRSLVSPKRRSFSWLSIGPHWRSRNQTQRCWSQPLLPSLRSPALRGRTIKGKRSHETSSGLGRAVPALRGLPRSQEGRPLAEGEEIMAQSSHSLVGKPFSVGSPRLWVAPRSEPSTEGQPLIVGSKRVKVILRDSAQEVSK